MTIFIGDTHGNWNAYNDLVKQADELGHKTVHVGDVGLGFGNDPDELAGPNHRFIRGNHDCLKVCRTYPNFIEDGTVEQTRIGPIMYVGGAWSIDHMYRKPGVDWWDDEQITLEKAYEIFDLYQTVKPEVMVSHDIPASVAKIVFNVREDRMFLNTTNMLFDEMMRFHQPAIWVAGHWHQNVDQFVNGCRFRIVGIDCGFGLDL